MGKDLQSKQVEHLLLQRNEKKLQESNMSPFSTTTNTSLSHDLGHTGSDQIIDQILNGEYIVGEDIFERHDSKELSSLIDSLAGYGRESRHFRTQIRCMLVGRAIQSMTV